jgi:hypothetical protein
MAPCSFSWPKASRIPRRRRGERVSRSITTVARAIGIL